MCVIVVIKRTGEMQTACYCDGQPRNAAGVAECEKWCRSGHGALYETKDHVYKGVVETHLMPWTLTPDEVPM